MLAVLFFLKTMTYLSAVEIAIYIFGASILDFILIHSMGRRNCCRLCHDFQKFLAVLSKFGIFLRLDLVTTKF